MRHTLLAGKEIVEAIKNRFYGFFDVEFTFIDCTFGQGLQATTILDSFPKSKCIAIDWDSRNIETCKNRYKEFGDRIQYYHMNYVDIKNLDIDFTNVHFVIIDVGSHIDQILDDDYGMSYQKSEQIINFRIDNTKDGINAKHVLNNYSKDQLMAIFKHYGNVLDYKGLTSRILAFRYKHGRFHRVGDILSCCINSKPAYVSKVFQAIRIEVNGKIEAIFRFLYSLNDLAKKVNKVFTVFSLTFNSLEDKIFKNFAMGERLPNTLETLFMETGLINRVREYMTTAFPTVHDKRKIVFKGYENRRKDLFYIMRLFVISHKDENKENNKKYHQEFNTIAAHTDKFLSNAKHKARQESSPEVIIDESLRGDLYEEITPFDVYFKNPYRTREFWKDYSSKNDDENVNQSHQQRLLAFNSATKNSKANKGETSQLVSQNRWEQNDKNILINVDYDPVEGKAIEVDEENNETASINQIKNIRYSNVSRKNIINRLQFRRRLISEGKLYSRDQILKAREAQLEDFEEIVSTKKITKKGDMEFDGYDSAEPKNQRIEAYGYTFKGAIRRGFSTPGNLQRRFIIRVGSMGWKYHEVIFKSTVRRVNIDRARVGFYRKMLKKVRKSFIIKIHKPGHKHTKRSKEVMHAIYGAFGLPVKSKGGIYAWNRKTSLKRRSKRIKEACYNYIARWLYKDNVRAV